MNESVAQVVQVELTTASPNVAVFVEITLDSLIDTREQCEDAEVELATMDQQRLVYVTLYDDSRSSHFGFG